MPTDGVARAGHSLTPARLVGLVCAAQVFVQIGAFFWPALLPEMMGRWSLSNSEAGWITSAFYAAYMVSVPVLVTLTDRVDAKRVYLFGVGCTVFAHVLFGLTAQGFWSAVALRALAGMGWAGTYMTGLKLLADQVDTKLMSRAVTGHAASIGISGAVSFALGHAIASGFGGNAAFLFAGGTAVFAWLAVALAIPRHAPVQAARRGGRMFDFRPVIANRSAMAYAMANCVHTLEMSALRGWGVAFQAWVAARTGAASGLLSPTVIVTTLALIGTAASVAGNEMAIRFGRRRLVAAAMVLSIVLALALAIVGSLSYGLAVGLLLAYGLVVWLDSSSLTAGAAGTADPARRGATLAVHSTLGYSGGFIGPLAVGWVLDLSGGMSRLGWGIAFALVAMLMAIALGTFLYIRPRGLEGDRSAL
jgi:MFS family permease